MSGNSKGITLASISLGVQSANSLDGSTGGSYAKAVNFSNMSMGNRTPNLFAGREGLGRGTNNLGISSVQNYKADSELIYRQAEFIIEMLAKNRLTLTMLSVEQKLAIFLYLFKYHSKLGRIVELFVNIPLSGMELRYPEDVDNVIVKDYIKDFLNIWLKT